MEIGNDFWVLFAGQEGIERRACFLSNGERVDLDQFDEVRVHIAAKPGTSALLVDVAMTKDDQSSDNGDSGTEGKGWATYTVEATGAALAAKTAEYYGSLVGVKDDVPEYFPTRRNSERTFFKVKINDPLGP